MAKCSGTKRDTGERCKANAKGETAFCRWHSLKPEDIAAHAAASSEGGRSRVRNLEAKAATGDALAADGALDAINFGTATGLKELLSTVLRALTRGELSVRSAYAIAQVANYQKAVIVESDHGERLLKVEEFLAAIAAKR